MSNQDTQYLIRKVSTCSVCKGKKFLQNPKWEALNITFDMWMREHGKTRMDDEAYKEWNDRKDAAFPYGEPPEEEPCGKCEGEGKIEEWIDLPVALQELGILQMLRDTVLILQNQETLNRMVHLKTRLETLNQNLAEALDAARA